MTTKKSSDSSSHSHSHSNSAAYQGGQNAWMITTLLFAGLLLASLVWNGFLTIMLVDNGGMAGIGTQQAAPTPTGTPPAQVPDTQPVAVSADDDPVKGDPNAPVEIIEFSDFECPFCGRFYSDSYKQIVDNYVESGDVKIVYRDFPLSFHPRAMPAAIAGECVQELEGDDAYFVYHDAVFENQGDLSDAALRSHALAAGANGAAFDDCFADADGSMRAEVNADMQAGQAAGVSGTPTVFVNGRKIVGAQPYSVFKAAIDAELGN